MSITTRFAKELQSITADGAPLPVEITADKRIGGDAPTFIIAEAAANHMCDIDTAIALIDRAAEAGADAVKFQTYKADKLVRKDATLYWHGKETSQLEYYSRLDRFGDKEYAELFEHAKQKNIILFSTPFDTDSADMLNSMGAPLFKIASCDLPDSRLLTHVAKFGKPIILSAGGSTPEEVDQAIETIYAAGNFKLILLACTLSYPTKNEDANLRQILALKKRYPFLNIGLSDHTHPDKHMVIPALAVALGASAIEKHYTLDREMEGFGHFFAIDPSDLKMMIENVRVAETVLGDENMDVTEAEKPAREKARRSIVAAAAISEGTVITSDMLAMKRPADGLPGFMMDKVIGKKAIRDIAEDETIAMDQLSEG